MVPVVGLSAQIVLCLHSVLRARTAFAPRPGKTLHRTVLFPRLRVPFDLTKHRGTQRVPLCLVPVVGLEPTRYRYQRILSPSRLPIPSHWPVDTGLLYRRSERNSSPFSHALTPYRSARRTIRRAQRLWVLYSFIRPPSSLAETRLPLPVSQFRIARASA